MKILIFGLKSAGKTCLIQNVLGGKSWKELQSINATEFIDSRDYIYRGLLHITVFDLGGQKQFINEYYTQQWANNIFSNCMAFYFVVDSSNTQNLNNAKQEFYKSLSFLTKLSKGICKKITLVISKCDISRKSPKEIRKFIFDHPNYTHEIKSINVSIPRNTARKNFGKSLNDLIPSEIKSRQELLNNICSNFNNKTKSIYSLILNKTDGLEIASAIDKKLVSNKVKEELEYTSLKTLIYSEQEGKIFKLLKDDNIISDNIMNFRLWQNKQNIIILSDFSEYTGFFTVFKSENFNYDKIKSSINIIKDKVNKLIKE
ncbi:MAG: ADP-ribosylation factor-like protein [Candidatus Helarchaeota archaeon]